MTEPEYTIINDVFNLKKQVVCKRGVNVKIIFESLPAVIVEDSKGYRFTTRIENIIKINKK